MKGVFFDFDFTASPIGWCKKNMVQFDYNGRQGDFWFSNQNCGAFDDMTEEKSFREKCPLAKRIAETHPDWKTSYNFNDEYHEYDDIPMDSIHFNIAAPHFEKRFQLDRRNGNAAKWRAQGEFVDFCHDCAHCTARTDHRLKILGQFIKYIKSHSPDTYKQTWTDTPLMTPGRIMHFLIWLGMEPRIKEDEKTDTYTLDSDNIKITAKAGTYLKISVNIVGRYLYSDNYPESGWARPFYSTLRRLSHIERG
ncbi:MAG: hypothetical protein LBG89_02785 [Rickettsiales bacterium]|jgi:hypothetical protein|nr:hypothetical protein [Rickettsiales bacterium]